MEANLLALVLKALASALLTFDTAKEGFIFYLFINQKGKMADTKLMGNSSALLV